MASFHDLLQQLLNAHEADVNELRQTVKQLQEQLESYDSYDSYDLRDRNEEASLDMEQQSLESRLVPEALHYAPKPVEFREDLFEPIIKVFGREVKQLGIRVQWNVQRPNVQRVVEGFAAEDAGIRQGDLLMAINGTKTEGRPRQELLALLQHRPLTLELLRRAPDGNRNQIDPVCFGTPQESLYHLQSSRSHLGDEKPSPTSQSSPSRRAKIKLDAVKEEPAKSEADAKSECRSEPRSEIRGAIRPPKSPKCEVDDKEERPLPVSISNMTLRSGQGHNLHNNVGTHTPRGGDDKKNSEGTQTYLGLRRFITARKESTASVAQLGSGHENRMTPLKVFHSMIKWWSHLDEPDRSGHAFSLLESRIFNSMSSAVIIMHAVVVTMSSDWEVNNVGKTAPESFHYMEMIFLGFYALELILRVYVHRWFFFIGENAGWNWFDFFLVVFSLVDFVYLVFQMTATDATGGNVSFMRLFRLFKITKILRTIRIIKVFRELSMMVESFTKCVVAMFWGLVLLVFLLYIFALVFVQGITEMLRDTNPADYDLEAVKSQFGSVLDSMLSLYMAVTGGNDWAMYFDTVKLCGIFYTVLFLLYSFFFVFALFNIMTGVFVERVLTAAIPDRDELIWEEQKRLAKQVEDFKTLCKEFDTDGSGTVTREEFRRHMRNDTMVSYMASVGLELHDVEHFFRTVAGEDQEVSIDRFVEGCMAMRGHATALDVQRQLFESKRLEDNLNGFRKETRETMSKVERLLVKALSKSDVEEPCEEASKCKPNSAKPEQLAPSAQPRSHA